MTETPPPPRPGTRWKRGLLLFVLVLGFAAAGFLLLTGPFGMTLMDPLASLQAGLTKSPERVSAPTYFALMALLVAVSFPVLPLYLLAVAYGPWTALIGSTVAVLVAMLVDYALGRSWLAPHLEAFLRRRGARIPTPREGEHLEVAFLLRMAPGVPFGLSSLVSGLAGIRPRAYWAISLPLHFAYAGGTIVLGETLFTGNAALLLGGLFLLLVVGAVAKIVRGRMAASARAQAA